MNHHAVTDKVQVGSITGAHKTFMKPIWSSEVIPGCRFPHPAAQGDTAGDEPHHRLCRAPVCPLGCPYHSCPGHPDRGYAPRLSPRWPSQRHVGVSSIQTHDHILLQVQVCVCVCFCEHVGTFMFSSGQELSTVEMWPRS